MVTKSKLRLALAAEKGVDFKKLKEKRKLKAIAKQQTAEPRDAESDEDEDAELDQPDLEEGDDDVEEDERDLSQINLEALDDSDTSESSLELEEKIDRKALAALSQKITEATNGGADEDDEDEEEDDEDIPVSDLEDLDDEDREDLIPHTRLTINNTSALIEALNRIALPIDKSTPFATHQSILASAETAASIPDVSDDLQRELAFYSQSLEAVRQARTKLRAEGVPFSRPKDYFAEMVKEDAHMEKVKAKLIEEAAGKKAAAEARKLRDLKKFGKKVQVAKLQERAKEKRETLDKIKTLKRKRQESGGDVGTNEAELFDVGVDHELGKDSSRSKGEQGRGRGDKNGKRQKKDAKYGFGGKKRHGKSGDAVSSGDLSGYNAKGMKAGGKPKFTKAARPGKARRKSMGSK